MTPVEIMALMLVIMLFLKLGAAAINPASLMSLSQKIYGSSCLVLTGAGLAMAGLTGYFLLKELSIVYVFACMFFFSALTMISIAPFAKELIEFSEKIMSQNVLKKMWVAWLVWVFLAFWVLKELFI